MGCPPVRGDNTRALASELSYVKMDKNGMTIYTIYISVDLAHHDIFRAKIGKGGIKRGIPPEQRARVCFRTSILPFRISVRLIISKNLSELEVIVGLTIYTFKIKMKINTNVLFVLLVAIFFFIFFLVKSRGVDNIGLFQNLIKVNTFCS